MVQAGSREVFQQGQRSPSRDAVEMQSCTVSMGPALMIPRVPSNSQKLKNLSGVKFRNSRISIHGLSNFTMMGLRNRNVGENQCVLSYYRRLQLGTTFLVRIHC